MKLSTRLALAMVALVLFTAAAFALLTYRDLEAAIVPGALDHVTTRVKMRAAELESYVRAASTDVLGLRAAAPIEAVARGRHTGGIDPVDGISESLRRARAARHFAGQMDANPSYLQLRIISLADGGRELVRVERARANAPHHIVLDDELQERGERDYFTATSKLPAGTLYVSAIDLDGESGGGETPRVPVLRVATTLQTAEGQPFGILIVDLDMQPAFDRIRATAEPGSSVYVVNQRGDYLVHPDRIREFAFESGRTDRLQDGTPQLETALTAAEPLALMLQDADGKRLAAAAATARFAATSKAIVVETLPEALIMGPAFAAHRSIVIATIVAALLAIGLAVLLSRSVSRSLTEMTAAVQALGRGGQVAVPISARGEVGVLARAFERMQSELRSGSTKLKEYARRERFVLAAVESSNYAFITVDPHGTITAWNPGAERLFGFSADEAIGEPLAIIIPADKREESNRNREKIHRREGVANLETVRMAKGGRRISVVIDGSPIQSRSGNLLGSSIIARDATAEKLAEEMFRLAVESCPSGMIMVDRTSRIVLVNTETERLFGYERDELIGQPVSRLVPIGLTADEGRNCERPALLNGHNDLVGVRKDASKFPVEVHSNPIHIGDGRLVLGVVVDISERRQNERLKDEFVSTVSHELRTPLTSIAGSLGLLIGGATGAMPEPTMRLLKIAHKNSERLVRLINDILDIEKIESGKVVFDLKRVDVRALVEQAIDANRGFAEGYGVRLRLNPGATPVCVRADGDRLMQVVTNLLSNAIKFSPPQEEVVVAIEQRAGDVRIAVRDHGIGIPEEFKPRIFEKFAQADATDARQKGGTGLGLSIVKQIVTLLGGTVGFDSPTGGGTIFHVDLPRWELGGESEGEGAAAPVAPCARVLICDDDAAVAKTLSLRLEMTGLAADIALSAQDALRQARASQYDAVLVDLKLQDCDGISLIQDLRGEPTYENTPIVVISADPDRGRDDIRSASLDVLDWLNKPIDMGHLVAVLERPIARGDAARPSILHIDDDASVLEFLAEAVGSTCAVTSVTSVADARSALAARRFDLVVLDLMLSQASGLDLLPELRSGDGKALPVILYSARAANGTNAARVQAALTKSHTSIDHLILTLRSHMAVRHAQAQQTREVA